jgi:hypothetical protein
MNAKTFKMMRWLMMTQPYILDFVVYEGQQIDINFDLTREMRSIPMPNGSIHHWPWFVAPEFSCDLSVPWLDVGGEPNDYIIVNRTARYQNPYIDYFFLHKLDNIIIFVGDKTEHSAFNSKWNLNLPHHEVNDFLELAELIGGCKLFIGNQSFCWHLADAMKVKRVLEYCHVFPNTHPTGADGCAVLHQAQLELMVNKMLQ